MVNIIQFNIENKITHVPEKAGTGAVNLFGIGVPNILGSSIFGKKSMGHKMFETKM